MSTSPTLFPAIPDWLSLEIAQRMEEKLSIVKLNPQEIYQSGCLHPAILHKRFPQAKNYCSKLGTGNAPWQRLFFALINRPFIEQISQADPKYRHAMDLAWSNLELQHHSQPELLIQEWERLLKPSSLLMLSYLGPDTGQELRQEGSKNLPSAWDMHDVGDALAKAGFAEPVMDMEYITLEYESLELLRKDALELGLIQDQTPSEWKLPTQMNQLKLTLEVVYGHAWTPEKRSSKSKDGIATISVDQIVRRK